MLRQSLKLGIKAQIGAKLRQYSSTDSPGVERSIQQLLEATKSMSFLHPPVAEGLSPELRDKLNKELRELFHDFIAGVDIESQQAKEFVERIGSADNGVIGDISQAIERLRKVSSISISEGSEPYAIPEMYMRQAFHTKNIADMGANISDDVYKPSFEAAHPKSVYETGISELIAAGAHLGHATSRLRPNCMPYIYGVREGIHIIDLQQTLASLRRVSKVVRELSANAGIILFVGTRKGQEGTVERAAKRAKGYYVYKRWVPGTFTNFQIISEQKRNVDRLELNMADEPSDRQLSPSLFGTIIKPDLVVVLNPVENRALLSECIKMRIPTTGIIDTDSEPSLLTYPIPGNDDSIRFNDLVLGVLSRQAELGNNNRLSNYQKHVQQVLKEEEEAEHKKRNPDDGFISENERKLAESQ